MSHYRSPLGRYISTPRDPELIKRDGWREEGILVVDINDERLSQFQREFIKVLGEKLYGRNCDR